MKFFNKYNRRAGFTLAELCVVMAVGAIVVAMVGSFFVFFSHQNEDITKNSARISEITKTQSVIHEWIRVYDEQVYDIKPNADQSKLVVYKGEEQVDSLYYSDGVLVANSGALTEKLKDISGVSFGRVCNRCAFRGFIN